MKLGGYLRCSTVSQVEMYGLEVQRERIMRWAAEADHDVIAWYSDEGVTGKTVDREGLQEAVEAVGAGIIEGIVAADMDRLSRKLELQEAILGTIWMNGGRVFTCGGEVLQDDPEDPMRTLVRQIMGAIAEFEAVNIRLRMMRGRRKKMADGGYGGGHIIFGRRLSGDKVVEHPLEKPVVDLMLEWRRDMTLEHLTEKLNSEKLTNRGKPWNIYSVRRVLKNWTREEVTG